VALVSLRFVRLWMVGAVSLAGTAPLIAGMPTHAVMGSSLATAIVAAPCFCAWSTPHVAGLRFLSPP